MRLAIIAIAAMAIAGPALAQAGAGAPPVKTKKIDDPNRIVCKREHVVGSNRPQKVCMTARERERLKDQADQITDPGGRTVADKETLRQTMSENGG